MTSSPQSQIIFQKIKKAQKVLLALHINPDGDAVASNLAFASVLKRWGKKVIVSSSDVAPFSFLPYFRLIKNQEFSKIALDDFDLILFLDIAELKRVSREESISLLPKITTINIDHHITNKRFAEINLVQPRASSTCEILYGLLDAFDIKFDKNLASLLYFGILCDTLGFKVNISPELFQIASFLLKKGANHKKFISQLSPRYYIEDLQELGEILKNLQIDRAHRFAWLIVPCKLVQRLKNSESVHSRLITFLRTIEGTDLAFLLWEAKKGQIRGGLRSKERTKKSDFDVSKLAQALGGGGHRAAAGFYLATNLKEAEKRALQIMRRSIRSKVIAES